MNTRSARKSTRSASAAKQIQPKEASPKAPAKRSPKPKTEKPVYIVEEILDKQKIKGTVRYKVKWVGFPLDQCTWEPAKNLENVRYMVTEFNKTHRKEEDSDHEKADDEEHEEEEKEEEDEEKGSDEDKKEKTPTKTTNGKRRLSSSKKESVSKSPQKKVKGETGGVPAKRGRHPKPVPNKIINAKQTSNGLVFIIEWKPLKDGTVPPHSSMNNVELRKLDKDLLLDYYESKLKFVKTDSATKSIGKGDHEGSQGEKSDKSEAIKSPIRSPVRSPVRSPGQNKNNPVTIEEEQEQEVSSLINLANEAKKAIEETVLNSTNLIENEGQTIFADLGTNTVPEIRELTLDANLRIYDQSNKEATATDQASLKAQDAGSTENKEFQIESPKEISDL